MTLFAKILTLIPLIVIVVSNSTDSEFSRNDESGFIARKVVTNSSNISSTCNPKIVQSSLRNVEKAMRDSKTNVIKLNVRIESVNDIINKTWVLRDTQWVNEVGRTLYSLMHQAKYSLFWVTPQLPSTLTTGVRDVNIIVSEENERCLLSENKTSEHVIFHLLLRQLYHVSNDDTDYMLCRIHIDDVKHLKYNCCAIVGEKNKPMCFAYSSIVAGIFDTILFATVISFVYVAIPLMLDYLGRFKEESIYYKISDSPMSLSSIMHYVFIEGHGPVKSVGRKLLFVIFVLVKVFPLPNIVNDLYYTLVWWMVLCPWALWFLFFDAYNFNEDTGEKSDPQTICGYKVGNPIEIIALPFNLELWWKKFSKEWSLFYDHLKLNYEGESTTTEHQETVTETCAPKLIETVKKTWARQWKIWKYRLSVTFLFFVYLAMSIPLCLFAFVSLLAYCQRSPSKRVLHKHKWLRLCMYNISLAIGIFLIMYSAYTFFGFTFLFVIGLFLNGETYSPYYVPLSTILFYSWVNWKSSVETKYLVLNTNIYEVCKESAATQTNNIAETINNTNSPPQATEKFAIELDEDGEPIIEKKLYNVVRKTFLPYDRVLFQYFIGVFIVAVFAYFLYVLISLFQTSGISRNVQVIGSIAATTLPIIFDFVWRKNSGEQNMANTIALKSKLKRYLVVHSSDDTNGKIEVEVTGNN